MKKILGLLLGLTVVNTTGAWATVHPTDATIQYWVTRALEEDPRVRFGNVTVVVDDGIATLSGTVSNLAARSFALREAKKIDGVLGIEDRIAVEPESREDSAIESDVRRRLESDPLLASKSLDVDAIAGSVSLDGTVDSWPERQQAELLASEVRGVRKIDDQIVVRYEKTRSDDEIRKDVRDSLVRDVYLTDLPIQVLVDDGIVTLSGTVGSVYEKERAADDAWRVWNTRSVENDISVEWAEDVGTRRTAPAQTDPQIERAVESELMQDLRISTPYSVKALVSHGHVTLSGSVPSYYQKRMAGRDARDAVGVAWVTNDLTVGAARRGDSALKTDIEQRLDGDYVLFNERPKVSVHDGIVTLEGNVLSAWEKSHATDVVGSVAGVLEVRNDLDVKIGDKSDDELAKVIRRDLESNWETSSVADDIKVSVNHGKVLLDGEVTTWAERSEAGWLALLAAGVSDVDNNLQVEDLDYPWETWHLAGPVVYFYDPWLM